MHSLRQTDPWAEYRPSAERPWDVRRVAHLHRRAGFGATWYEIKRDLKEGPQAAVDRLLNGQAHSPHASPQFEQTAKAIADAAVGSGNANRLKAWWLFRMLFSPDPLGERLTLMWHNHFATSNVKISDVGLMRQQNEILRSWARAPFGELLSRVVKDPAMLVWLDADANRKEHPNENLAREIMELFSLGVGNYTETDIKQAARALSGWSVKSREFHNYDRFHDDGEKKIFGQTGNWNGDDLLRLLQEHHAVAQRVAFRLCEMLMGESVVDHSSVDELADGLRRQNLDVGWGIAKILRSESFFSESNIGNRVLSPVEYAVSTVRALEMFDPPPSTLLLAESAANLGQDLFYPPNVFGWPGGRSWLSSRGLIGRANLASAFIAGKMHYPAHPYDAAALASRHGFDGEQSQRDFFTKLLLGSRTASPHAADGINDFVVTILASPEAQLS